MIAGTSVWSSSGSGEQQVREVGSVLELCFDSEVAEVIDVDAEVDPVLHSQSFE